MDKFYWFDWHHKSYIGSLMNPMPLILKTLTQKSSGLELVQFVKATMELKHIWSLVAKRNLLISYILDNNYWTLF